MEQKKYKLTKETMCFDGVTLHRIQALKDFGNVDAGELGGWLKYRELYKIIVDGAKTEKR